ncbi:MAG TPA: DUF924 family protein [Alphaproteobacteria bacterium]
MVDEQKPTLTERVRAEKGDRERRLAAALRENLRRRKQQARQRAERAEAADAMPMSRDANIGAARLRAVLDFWFLSPGDPEYGRMRKIWFAKDAAFDAEIRARFLADHEAAARGAYDAHAGTADGALALVILLDQFPRNLFRDDRRAFATDAKAREIANMALARAFDRQLRPVERMFLYLPFEHSEDLADQERAVALMESLPATPEFSEAVRAEVIDYARRHRDIVARFGRFPHRNAALGRTSTPEETAFLAQPGSRF